VPVSSPTIAPQSRRIPQHDGGVLADPPLRHGARIATETQHILSSSDIRIAGVTLGNWRDDVAADTIAAACEYATHNGRVPPPHDPAGPLVVGGHQPTLFHCGVLLKNFGLSRLAQQAQGTALNLIVDNDISTPHHLALPDGSREQPATRLVPFSTDNSARPWEDIKPSLSATFTGLPDRVTDALSRWNISPVLPSIWPAAISSAEKGDGLAECLSAARISLQDQFGHGTLELPISRLATRQPFLRFMAMVLLQADRFQGAYNRALNSYRKSNRIRSRTHPAANLERIDSWLETPFWCWKIGDTHRRRLLVRATDTTITISDGSTLEEDCRLGSGSNLDNLATQLGQWQQGGLKIRPSALSTTLFARVFLADLFIHGIGGAKYDEVTDALMADFFGIAPPQYMTLSGTLHLPLGGCHDVSHDDRSRLISRRRRMIHNAQDFLSDGQAVELRERKTTLIAQQQADRLDNSDSSIRNRQIRYHEFRDVNRELNRHTIGARQALEGDLQELDRQLNANSVLASRDFSFCLFPESRLREFFDNSLADLN